MLASRNLDVCEVLTMRGRVAHRSLGEFLQRRRWKLSRPGCRKPMLAIAGSPRPGVILQIFLGSKSEIGGRPFTKDLDRRETTGPVGSPTHSTMPPIRRFSFEAFIRLGHTAMFVGDGGNDSGALRAAHVSLALTEATHESSLAASWLSGAFLLFVCCFVCVCVFLFRGGHHFKARLRVAAC